MLIIIIETGGLSLNFVLLLMEKYSVFQVIKTKLKLNSQLNNIICNI